MKLCLMVLLLLSAWSLVCVPVSAYSETFRLAGSEDVTREVQVNADDVVSGRVTMVGSAINLLVTDPDNAVILNYTANPLDFKFTAEKSGTYHIQFNNHNLAEVYVTFNYNVQRYLFGFPQEFVILFVIVGIALIAIAIFVAASPKP